VCRKLEKNPWKVDMESLFKRNEALLQRQIERLSPLIDKDDQKSLEFELQQLDPVTVRNVIGSSFMSSIFKRALERSSFECFGLLIQLGCDLNCVDELTGNTALHLAAVKKDKMMIRWLLKHGASAEKVNKEGMRPMDLVTDSKFLNEIFLIVQVSSCFWPNPKINRKISVSCSQF
jgi:ankyrin repeat protein